MKKTYFIFALMAGCMALATSCSDDGSKEFPANTVQVTSAETELAAAGESKTFTVTGTGLTASVPESCTWLTVAVSGNQITVTAEPNLERQTRHTIVNIVASNGDKTGVSVSQYGAIFTLDAPANLSISDGAQEISYAAKYNLPISLRSSADWLKVNMTDDAMVVTATANNSGHPRSGYVYYEIGTVSDSILVVQCDFDMDIVGKVFYLAGSNPSTGEITYELVQIKKEGADYALDLIEYSEIAETEISSPIFKQNEFTFNLPMGYAMGQYGNYILGWVGWDANEGYITWSNSVGMNISFSYDEEYGVTVGEMVDDGAWGSYEINALQLYAFSSEEFTSSTRVGYFNRLVYPWMEEYVEEEEAAAPRRVALKSNSRAKAPVFDSSVKIAK